MVIPCSTVVASYPGIETLLENTPKKHEGLVPVKWVMTLYDPKHHAQGKSTCRCRAWAVAGIDYFYEMDPSMSKELADNVQDELQYLLENGEPEEVRKAFGRCGR